jgi:probable rRNA maturation factor
MLNNQPRVYFHFAETSSSLSNRRVLKEFIKTLFIEEKKELGELNYIFCSDNYLLDLNLRFLTHNFLTDILSFNLSKLKAPIQGEIYISMERVHENATRFSVSFRQELHRVIFHGALHLCGYKDKSSKDSIIMRRKEDYYLKRYEVLCSTNHSSSLEH